MSRKEKLIQKLKSRPKDFTYDELKTLLNYLGFFEYNKGKTSGSRIVFINYCDLSKKIELHKPHPIKIIKMYKIKEVIKLLEEWRLI